MSVWSFYRGSRCEGPAVLRRRMHAQPLGVTFNAKAQLRSHGAEVWTRPERRAASSAATQR